MANIRSERRTADKLSEFKRVITKYPHLKNVDLAKMFSVADSTISAWKTKIGVQLSR